MKIEFDPHNPDDLKTVARLLDTSAQPAVDSGERVTISVTPEQTAEPEQPHDPSETDCHGMPWRDDIHSSPPTKNADGSWRAKRGKKDEYDAAYAELSGDPAPAPAPTAPTMPTGPAMPAAPAPTAPVAPITYHQMAERFVGSLETFGVEFTTIYNDLGVDFNDLETNVTSINRLWRYMDNRAAGQDHPTAAAGAKS